MILFLTLVSLSPALQIETLPALQRRTRNPSPALHNGEDCISKAYALHNLTALGTQVVLDSGNPENNEVVFQLFNPITGVSGECAAHGASLAQHKATGDPESWYNCFVESRDPSITVQFQFDSVLSQLIVNETWACERNDGNLTYVPYLVTLLGCRRVDHLVLASHTSARMLLSFNFRVRFEALGSCNLTMVCNDKGSQRLCSEGDDVLVDVYVSTTV